MDFFRDHHEALPALWGGKAPLNKVPGGPQPCTLRVTQACGRAHSWLFVLTGKQGGVLSCRGTAQHCIPLNFVFTFELVYLICSISKSNLAVEA